MTYQSARDRTLELIDRYSVAGARVEASYNNQADYLHRIPGLLDDAQVLAASSTHPIRAVRALSELPRTREGEWELCTLPEDCRGLCGGLILAGEDGPERWDRYRLLGRDRLAVPAELTPRLRAEYYRDPVLLGEDPADEAELDNTLTVQAALPYYAAAHLSMQDDTYVYATLMNEFHSRLAAGVERVQVSGGVVRDVYGGEGQG